jgi:hypothetical protein
MQTDAVNWLAVIAAALSAFILGGIWYSPVLFGNAWMKENRFTLEIVKAGNKARIFGWSLFLTLIMSINLAMFLNTPDMNFVQGLTYGLLAGVWVFCGIAIVALFELKGWLYILVNGGYCLVSLGVMGAIIGAWR